MARKMPYPHKWHIETDEECRKERERLYENFSCLRNVLFNDGLNVPPRFADLAEKMYNMEVRDDDVWIITYPKCGTTWTQELVWNIVHDMDSDVAQYPLLFRAPYPDYQTFQTTEVERKLMEKIKSEPDNVRHKMQWKMMLESFEWAVNAPSPRVLRTHMPLKYLPPNLLDKAKVIYVTRNPKDCCTSFHYLFDVFPDAFGYKGTFKDTCKMFMDGSILYGNYWDHLKQHWPLRNHKNFKLIHYEDMKRDLIKILMELGEFVGKPMTKERANKIKDSATLDGMRTKNFLGEKGNPQAQKDVNKFFRKGVVGDWKNHEMDHEAWDKWIEENLKGTDIEIKFK